MYVEEISINYTFPGSDAHMHKMMRHEEMMCCTHLLRSYVCYMRGCLNGLVGVTI